MLQLECYVPEVIKIIKKILEDDNLIAQNGTFKQQMQIITY